MDNETIRAMAQQISRAFDRQVFGAFTEPDEANQPGGDIVADLEQAALLLSRPVPVAIWFIDRPDEYYQMLAQTAMETSKKPCFTVHQGMPLYRWTLADILAGIEEMIADGCNEFVIAERFPFRLPGVWVQMRNAPHMRLVAERELDRAEDQIKRQLAKSVAE